jgi:hypothetical protein
MEKAPQEHQKVLQDLDRLLGEAPDEASRQEIRRLRDSLNTPEMIEMARAAEQHKERRSDNPVLEFHDPLLPTWVTATGSVIAAAICLYALVLAFESPTMSIGGRTWNTWVVAVVAGAATLTFTALSVTRVFSVRFDTAGMVSRTSGARWRRLYVGAMPWKEIRSLRERAMDRVLEVGTASGEIFEIPMRVVNYPILREHLDNMVRLYGELNARP